MKRHLTRVVNRIISLNKTVLLFFIFFSLSVLIIEFILKEYHAYNINTYKIGVIYLNISYSFVSATFFYFIIVHLPNEDRKSKSYRYINNKSMLIVNEIESLVRNITNEKNMNSLTIEQLRESCESIRVNKQVIYKNTLFVNWFDFFEFKKERIKKLIGELFLINDVLSNNLIRSLTLIDDVITSHLDFSKISKKDEVSLESYSYELYELKENSDKLLKVLRNGYKKYFNEERLH